MYLKVDFYINASYAIFLFFQNFFSENQVTSRENVIYKIYFREVPELDLIILIRLLSNMRYIYVIKNEYVTISFLLS